MATKKIRLIDEEPVSVEETASGGGSLSAEQVEQLMKYAEAIDWKMWEILKLLREQTGK